MKRLGLAFLCVAMFGGLTACSEAPGTGVPDGGNTLPDGFLTTTCTTVNDCAPTSCQTAKCNPVTKMCEYKEKVCPSTSACATGMCDVSQDGACVDAPANENAACTTDSDEPGTCIAGTCAATPNCAAGFPSTVYCDYGSLSQELGNNTPMAFGGGAAVVGSYACAPSEAGPEIALSISTESGVGDEDITISLRLTDATGAVIADQAAVDLDLIILEDVCTASATCMNPAAGAVFQGVTAGTSAERVTFKAIDGHSYYAVVDGKDMNQVHDFIVEVEACGRCQPTDSTRLDCNMTMPISSSTATGAAVIPSYMCGAVGSKTTVAAAGKETPFLFKTPNSAARNVTATITGATAEVNVLAIPMSLWGQCRPDECTSSATSAAGGASLTFATDPGSNEFKRYWVVVDSSAADSNFGLEFTCSKACTTDYTLACNGAVETKIITNGTTVGGTTENAYWGPGAGPNGCDGVGGFVGPEAVARLVPTITTARQYDLVLRSKVAGENLTIALLDAGTTANAACDPGSTCMTNTIVSGGSFTGTRTSTGPTAPASIRFTAQPDHIYFVVVDSADTSGSTFDLQVIGTAGGGCL